MLQINPQSILVLKGHPMKRMCLFFLVVASVAILSQWNTFEMQRHLQSFTQVVSPVLYPFYHARGAH